jgi:flagellar biosynthesis protein FlhB
MILFNALLGGGAVRLGIGLIFLGVCAYGIVRWRFMKKMMMSLHEVKEESREQEGDPHVKTVRRHEHEALLMSDLAARVRQAKVIVVDRRSA